MENNENENVGVTDEIGNAPEENKKIITETELNEIKKQAKSSGRKQGIFWTLGIVAFITLVVISFKAAVNFVKDAIYPKSEFFSRDVELKADTLWGMIDKYFLWETDKDEAIEEMYKGMLDSLDDPYSCYYTKKEMDSLLESASGKYSGIGAYVALDTDLNVVYISNPMPGSPAKEAGLLPNDYIYEIDGNDVTGQELDVVVSKIKGPEGSKVVLGIRRNNEGDLMEVTIVRRTIEVEMLEYSMADDGIGYIWLYEFEQIAIDQFDKAYADLESQGMKGLILDLRDNPGGDLDAAVRLADEFLDEGIIVYTKDKNGKGSKYKSDAESKNIPLVIITNGNSASASEIVSGSLKDRGAATLVGKKTFGKGIVQSLFSLQDGTGLKVTESEYFLPNDECIHGVGIEPDYEVDIDIKAYREKKIDPQKDKAIELIKEMINK